LPPRAQDYSLETSSNYFQPLDSCSRGKLPTGRPRAGVHISLDHFRDRIRDRVNVYLTSGGPTWLDSCRWRIVCHWQGTVPYLVSTHARETYCVADGRSRVRRARTFDVMSCSLTFDPSDYCHNLPTTVIPISHNLWFAAGLPELQPAETRPARHA
jgi:hypothetical protein